MTMLDQDVIVHGPFVQTFRKNISLESFPSLSELQPCLQLSGASFNGSRLHIISAGGFLHDAASPLHLAEDLVALGR